MAHLTAQSAGAGAGSAGQRGPAGEAQVRVAGHAALGVHQDPLGAVHLESCWRRSSWAGWPRHRARGGQQVERRPGVLRSDSY